MVGPNGCGKSNVIDALRWVLGESRAHALRGENMQDVIFNGSDKRKPVARASVELVFDNSLGKAAGQWASYAEISIGRVLQRNGESSYFINNQKVRRRDVTDIFLGTGLGARAYAIVEQGMISRIIEAKPEELRVFLEEAAGVSKYRDRRKDTAQRLSDTRDNLQRVSDILQELDKQLERLSGQAEVARQYRTLEAQRDTTQQLLWLLKKQEAGALREKYAASIEQTRTGLEAKTASLRDIENRLETLRSSHFKLSDALHARQGELYSVNAEIAGLEQQIKHVAEQQKRLSLQIESAVRQIEQQQQQKNQSISLLEHWQGQQEEAEIKLLEAEQNAQGGSLEQAEAVASIAQAQYNSLQQEQLKLQQQQQLAQTHHDNLLRNIQQLETRRLRLLQEQGSLPRPDSVSLQQAKEALAQAEIEHGAYDERLADLQEQLPQSNQEVQRLRSVLQQLELQGGRTEARLHALEQLQQQPDHDKKLQEWLVQHGLDGLPRLWQAIRTENGWENALEAVLRERLNALPRAADSGWDVPPARVAMYEPVDAVFETAGTAGQLIPLLDYVQCQDAKVYPALREWLSSTYAVADMKQALTLRGQLPEGGSLVTPEGHLIGMHSVLFHAPDSQLHGVLARQREIEQLESDADDHKLLVRNARQQLLEAEQRHQSIEVKIPPLQSAVNASRQRQHALQMQILTLNQAHQQSHERSQQLAAEIGEMVALLDGEQQQQQEITLKMSLLRDDAAAHALQVDEAARCAHDQDITLREQRARAQEAQHALHEAHFFSRTCVDKIADLNANIQRIAEALMLAEQGMVQLRAELSECRDDTTLQSLQDALQNRHEAELALGAARNQLESATNDLQQFEQERMSCEHQLAELRERLNAYTLKEQEARLYFEQWESQLQGVDELPLLPLLAGAKPNHMQNELTRLDGAIAELGAVNLAALEELQTASERKLYLDAQTQDLQEAMTTLEEAIRHIDRESRELLMETFNQVNLQLAINFPVLFAGGEAKLVLTGEEILDGGVQVMAQPPGKKNSSIHLLSGGEKALTAIALIFSLFKLNPAPFCLLDEVDAPLDDTNTERLCALVAKMSQQTQFVFISHNKIAMEMAHQLIGVTMQEKGVSKVVSVDIEAALRMQDEAIA